MTNWSMLSGRIPISVALNINDSTLSRLRLRFEEFDSKPSTCTTTSCDDPCPGPIYPDSPSPRSPPTSRNHCRRDSRAIQSTDLTLNCPKLTEGSQYPRASRSTGIEPYPCSTTTAARLCQEEHLLDVSTTGEWPLPWRVTFPASQSRWATECVVLQRGAKCWRHRRN